MLDLSHFDSVSMISKKVDNVICDKKCTVSTFGENKINNNLLNILFCSDEPYFVGMFASLHSVLSNCSHVNKLMFNFIIPFIILLTVVVFIHEYGHYHYAKKYGVGVTDFSIGFGKEIFGFND